MEDYRNKVYSYLCQNGGEIRLSEVGDKFCSIHRSLLRATGKKAKQILQEDEQSRFVISGEGGGDIKLKCSVRATQDVEDYLNKVYCHLRAINKSMDLGDVSSKFGSIGKIVPKGTVGKNKKLKTILENDAKLRFILDTIGKDDRAQCIVRARPDYDRVEKRPSTSELSNEIEGSDPNPLEAPNIGKTIGLANKKTKCYYVDNSSGLQIVVERIQKLSPEFVSLGCKGAPRGLEILQIATSQEVYVVDCQRIGRGEACGLLESLITKECPIKLVHDLHQDAVALHKFGKVEDLVGFLDTQLLAELVWRNPSVGFSELLSRLDLPNHSGREFVSGREKGGVDLWSKRPIAPTSLEHAGMEVACLQNIAEQISHLLQGDQQQFKQLLAASASRAKTSIERSGFRTVCFDKKHNFALASAELMRATRPHDGFYGEPLEIESDVDEILSILPPIYTAKFLPPRKKSSIIDLFAKNNSASDSSVAKASSIMNLIGTSSTTTNEEQRQLLPIEKLSDIALDAGRRAHCWIRDSRVFLCDDETKVVKKEEIQTIVSHLGNFGSDNRAGLDGTHKRTGSLHRFSAMKDRGEEIMGITIRIGRNIKGNASMLMDLLKNHGDKSVLILGEPGSGKTTIVREATRKLAEEQNVIVVDTSNEIAGDGRSPHSCIGLARRMMVPSLDKQASVMVECVQNHTPHIMVIDEIGRSREVKASNTVKQRGVRMIASAHGDLRSLLKNKDLDGLVGGLESVTIGDEMAREEAKRKQKMAKEEHGDHRPVAISKTMVKRRSAPIFEIIVEVSRDSRHDWRIVHDSARAVDRILEGLSYPAQLRKRDPESGIMSMEWVDA